MKNSKKNNFDIGRKWYFFDLSGKILGREAVKIATLLRGRNELNFDYNLDLGSYIVIINADKVVLTGNNKLLKKKYYNHSGYPGGLRVRNASVMVNNYPEELLHRVVKGLMPHNKISRVQLKRLFVYRGGVHPHLSQEKDFLTV